MPDGKLPEPSTEFVVLGALLRTLEAREPGLVDDLISTLEDERLKSEVVRLRGPKLAPLMKVKLAEGLFWATSVRLVHRGTPHVPARQPFRFFKR